MICPACATAADQQLPRDQHCDETGGPSWTCACAHRTDRYQTKPERPEETP